MKKDKIILPIVVGILLITGILVFALTNNNVKAGSLTCTGCGEPITCGATCDCGVTDNGTHTFYDEDYNTLTTCERCGLECKHDGGFDVGTHPGENYHWLHCKICGGSIREEHYPTTGWLEYNEEQHQAGCTCKMTIYDDHNFGNDNECDDCGYTCDHKASTTTDECSICRMCLHPEEKLEWQEEIIGGKEKCVAYCECGEIVRSRDHNFDTTNPTGECTRDCGYTCDHEDSTTTDECSICGMCLHPEEKLEWQGEIIGGKEKCVA